MNDKSNIAIAISLVAFFISLYSLTSKSGNEDFFTKSPNKTYISPDPEAKRKVDNIEKNMRAYFFQYYLLFSLLQDQEIYMFYLVI